MSKMVKRILQIGIPVLVLAVIIVSRMNLFSAQAEAPIKGGGGVRGALQVTGMIAEFSESASGIRANGTLLPNEEVELVTEIVGKVRDIYFEEGVSVNKGDLLLKVDDADLQAQLSRAEFQKKLLAEKLERLRILLQRESVSKEAFDQLQTDYNMVEADIELLKVKINRTEIRAPFNGMMGFRYVSQGSYVQSNSKIATITDNSILKIEFTIPEKYVDLRLTGKAISFRVAGIPEDFMAKVYAIDPKVDDKTRTILMRARYQNTNRRLLPGMFASVSLRTGENNSYIQIPTEAVVPEMNGKRMWVVKNGKATSVSVETESRDQKNVEVVSGISVGDTVLTGGLMQLREGMGVKVEFQK